MIGKILKIELFSLFLLTITAISAFYYHDVLPDNSFSISSSTAEANVLTYLFSSLLGQVAYYTGPWLFFPFITFTLFYAFQYSKREDYIDAFNILSLLLSLLLLSYVAFPEFLGRGIFYLLSSTVSELEAGFFFFLTTMAFIAGSFRAGFFKAMISAYGKSKGFPSSLMEKMRRLSFHLKRAPHNAGGIAQRVLTHGLPHALKGEKDSRLSRSYEEKMAANPFLARKVNEEIERFSPEEKESFEDANSPRAKIPKDEAIKTYKQRRTRFGNEQQYFDIVDTMKQLEGRPSKNINPGADYFDTIIQRIEDMLADFRIDGAIVNILKGPVVDTFELELGPGVKVSKVTGAAEDLSLALYGAPIRIVYPMKGRTTIGVEVPRNPREIIYLDEVLAKDEFTASTTRLPVAMGKDAFGETFVIDLAGTPHMLVAGATGAGKSVFLNTMLVSLLVKNSPAKLKMILIDPKQLELALYSKLPHLILPVVTDAKSASLALMWAVQEMERRYTILSEMGVRNIEGYNEKIKTADPEKLGALRQYFELEPEDTYELPYLVIVVDEFADLILTKAGKEIENNICRLAAKARAAGIHLVLATQRPSVDVITGLIKSNFPTRVSFRVTTSIDSRTILNTVGAEKLLGKGDMLYKHGVETSRLHSAYVDENEIEALTAKLATFETQYHSGAMDFLENEGDLGDDPYAYGSHITIPKTGSSVDNLFDQALQLVMEHRSASASMLQRRLKVGYNRAANLIDELESKGIVGPAQGSKPREVLGVGDSL